MVVHRSSRIISHGVINLVVSIHSLDSLQRSNILLRFQFRRATTQSQTAGSILPHHKDMSIFLCFQRQYVSFVLKQDNTLITNLTTSGIMSLRALRTVTTVWIHRRAEDGPQHTCHLVVEYAHRYFAFVNQLLESVAHIEIIITEFRFLGHTVGIRTHFYIHSARGSLPCIGNATPVAHHGTIKTPLLFQYLIQQ